MLQTLSDLARHKGFRQYAYPSPLSKLGRKYSLRKWEWGFAPGDMLLIRYGERYQDGIPWAVGHGFTKNVKPESRMSVQGAYQRLQNELIKCLSVLDRLVPEWNLMPIHVKTVLVNLAYTLGYERLAKFGPTLDLIKAGDYEGAGNRLRKSAWYKQYGEVAQELVERLETGKIDPKHLVIPQPGVTNSTSRVTSTAELQGDLDGN